MLKYTLALILLFVSYASTAETIYFAKPTPENAKAHVQHKERENLHEIIWLVDPDTGDANRYGINLTIRSGPDEVSDSATTTAVVHVKTLGMSTDMQTFAKHQTKNYTLIQTMSDNMNGVAFDTFRLLEGNTGLLDTLIEKTFANVRDNFKHQSEGLSIHYRNVLSTEYQPIEFVTKDGFKIRLKFEISGSGTFIVTLLSVKNRAGTQFYPRPNWDSTNIELTNATPEELEALAFYLTTTGGFTVNLIPSSIPSAIPSGSVTIIDCKSSENKCDVTIRPEKNKQ